MDNILKNYKIRESAFLTDSDEPKRAPTKIEEYISSLENAMKTPISNNFKLLKGCSVFDSSECDPATIEDPSETFTESQSISSFSRHISHSECSEKMEIDMPPLINPPKQIEKYEDLVNLHKSVIFPSFSFNEKPVKMTPEFERPLSSSNSSINVKETNSSSCKISSNVSLNLTESKVNQTEIKPDFLESGLASPINFKKITESDPRYFSYSKTSEKQFENLFKSSVKNLPVEPEKVQNSSVLKKSLLIENRKNNENLKCCWSGLESNEKSGTRINSVFNTTGTKINSVFNTTGTNINSCLNTVEKSKDSQSCSSVQSKHDASYFRKNNPSLNLFSSQSKTTSDPTESSRNSDYLSINGDFSGNTTNQSLKTLSFLPSSKADENFERKNVEFSQEVKNSSEKKIPEFQNPEQNLNIKSELKKTEKLIFGNFKKVEGLDLYSPIKSYYGEVYAKNLNNNIGVLKVSDIKPAEIPEKKKPIVIIENKKALENCRFPESQRKYENFEGYSCSIDDRFKNFHAILDIKKMSEYSSVAEKDIILIMANSFENCAVLTIDESKTYFNKKDIFFVSAGKMFKITNNGNQKITVYVIRDRVIN